MRYHERFDLVSEAVAGIHYASDLGISSNGRMRKRSRRRQDLPLNYVLAQGSSVSPPLGLMRGDSNTSLHPPSDTEYLFLGYTICEAQGGAHAIKIACRSGLKDRVLSL